MNLDINKLIIEESYLNASHNKIIDYYDDIITKRENEIKNYETKLNE